MTYRYLVPQDTVDALNRNVARCQNFGLLFQRYAPHEAIFETDHYNDRQKVDGKMRHVWLQELCDRFEPNNKLIEAHYQRWLAVIEGAQGFILKARSPLVVGLGGKGALEFGLTLHRVTGLPYIPGSAIKGMCRAYMLLTLAEERGIAVESKALETLDAELMSATDDKRAARYQALFGRQGDAGEVVFYDACLTDFPEEGLFRLDVMTPHFRTYYENQGQQPPDDADSPNPITFLTVAPGCHFAFGVGMRPSLRQAPNEKLLAMAKKLMYLGLTEFGIGAKTAAGYGVFGDP